MKSVLRRLRGAIGNAVVWGVTWFSGAFAVFGAMEVIVGLDAPIAPWRLILAIATNVGITGFVTGLAFAGYLRLRHFDRPLLGIRVGRTALAGGTVAAAVSLGVGTLIRWSMGLPIGFADVFAGVPTVALFGAATAGATLHIAQRSARALTAGATADLEVEQEEARALLGVDAG